jgi:hypothetical protein
MLALLHCMSGELFKRRGRRYKGRAGVHAPQGGLDQLVGLGEAHHDVRVLLLELLPTRIGSSHGLQSTPTKVR